jgi:hypothetical protein
MASWRKSSFCESGNCVELAWIRPGRCASNECIEVAEDGPRIAVRDSKNTGGPVLVFGREPWQAFTRAVKDREFDIP